jgi:hypothetical protein
MQKPNPTRLSSKGRVVVVVDWTSASVKQRVLSKTDTSGGPDSCWMWTGSCDPKGYGSFHTSSSRSVTAHRAAWAVEHGREPEEGMVIDHLCRNHGCVNPSHLELVSNQTNIMRGTYGALKETCAKGHPWTEENYRFSKRKDGTYRRYCVICRREANRASYRKSKEPEKTNE